MEDVLEVYARPYDPDYPVVCLDEGRKELRSSVAPDLEMAPGRPHKEDYEYERDGAVSLFVAFEPLAGRRELKVTDQRTALEYAQFVKDLVDTHYPEAEKVVLVQDNLNTHTPASLYSAFEPQEARRICERLEWHYTPEHASWLNMAELELAALATQCLNKRMGNKAEVELETLAWKQQRNALQVKARWTFTTQQARVKLKRLYPEPKVKPST